MRRIKLLAAAAVLMVGVLLVPATPAAAATNSVCAGNWPPGWLKVDDQWDPTRCGNPVSIVYNVWTIESYYDKPVGWTMWVCSGWKPSGWGIVDVQWDPTRCGHPTYVTGNMWVIHRYY